MTGDVSKAKAMLGRDAARLVQPASVLGIGSGSTVMAFIDALGQRMRDQPFPLTLVAASQASTYRAQAAGLTVVPLESVSNMDLAIDGADAVDKNATLIKGGGAALVRERIIIASARRSLILVDASKTTQLFHQAIVPLAVIPFGWSQTRARVLHHAPVVSLRTREGHPVTTDDGLYILDATFDIIEDPLALHQRLKMIEGVVDTGLFVGYHPIVSVSDGSRIWVWNGCKD